MIGLLQRVTSADVSIGLTSVARIDRGLLVLICAERADREEDADKLLWKVLRFRMFADEQGRMNRSVRDIGGGVLIVPQFTLAADTDAGTRPSFTPAAPPERGAALFAYFLTQARRALNVVEAGVFGADMQVTLVNDGPATFWLQTPARTSLDRATS